MNYYGMPAASLGNNFLQIDYLLEGGPRLVRLNLAGLEGNLFAETPDLHWSTPYGEYSILGGHRLWHSPEAFPRSYIPDHAGLQVEKTAEGVCLTQPVEAGTGIRKSMVVQLDPQRPFLTLKHILKNEGLWPVELSAWAITQLRLGGAAILPQPTGPIDERGLLPNRLLVFWPYSRWSDERLQLADDLILVQARPDPQPIKVGYLNRCGWAGYYFERIFMLKRFEPMPDQPHPDFGCNVEVYCRDRFIELETLGPLVKLEPGEETVHLETWEFFTDLEFPLTIEGMRALVNSLQLG